MQDFLKGNAATVSIQFYDILRNQSNISRVISPARVIAKFAKTAPALEIKAGVVEGTFYDADGMKAIATIPSREELLSKFLGSIQSPITNFARVINQIAEKGGAADVEVKAEEAAPAEEAPVEAPAEEAPAAE